MASSSAVILLYAMPHGFVLGCCFFRMMSLRCHILVDVLGVWQYNVMVGFLDKVMGPGIDEWLLNTTDPELVHLSGIDHVGGVWNGDTVIGGQIWT